VVIPTVVGSSVCFFTMVLAFFQSHMSWSTYPGMSIMLPALWLPGFASGVVTGRFIWIYSAATARSPVLLRAMAGEETANLGNDDAGGVKRFVSVKGSLESSLFNAKPVVDPASSKGEAEGEWKNDDRCVVLTQPGDAAALAPPPPPLTLLVRARRYATAYKELMELCKHQEDIFGIRAFGLKVRPHPCSRHPSR
jgi:hypothetical protein